MVGLKVALVFGSHAAENSESHFDTEDKMVSEA